MTAHDLFLRLDVVESDDEPDSPPREGGDPMEVDTPTVPEPYVPHRKPTAATWNSSATASSGLNIPLTLAPVALTPVGRGRGRGGLANALNPPPGDQGRDRARGKVRGRGAFDPSNVPSMVGPTSGLPTRHGQMGQDPANPLTGSASFIPGNLDPALFGNLNNTSSHQASGSMVPHSTGPSLPPFPPGLGGFNPPPNPNGEILPANSGTSNQPSSSYHLAAGMGSSSQLSGGYGSNNPSGPGTNSQEIDEYLDEFGDIFGEHENPYDPSGFGNSDAGPSSYGTHNYPLHDNDATPHGFGSSTAGPFGYNARSAPLTANDANPHGFSSFNPPGQAPNPSAPVIPAPVIPTGTTRGTAGTDNDGTWPIS